MKNELTINDLSVMVQIIDTVSQRGAIRGDELLEVGAIRAKLMRLGQEMTEAEKSKAGESSPTPKKEALKSTPGAI